MVAVRLVMPDGASRTLEAFEGETVLELARRADIAIEGACGGSMACATCHIVVDEADFDRLDPPTEEEEDMLDLAAEWQPTSRLGCQIKLSRDLGGLTLAIPRSTLIGW